MLYEVITFPSFPAPAPRPVYGVLDKTSTWHALELAPRHWRAALGEMLDEVAGVITSYSIHYTKLYEMPKPNYKYEKRQKEIAKQKKKAAKLKRKEEKKKEESEQKNEETTQKEETGEE